MEISMRRTRMVAAAFAGSVCLAALGPAPAMASEPVAEVSPRRVHPGGSVTVTVTCGKHDEQVAYVTAYSRAFAAGEAKLSLLPRDGGQYGKPTYQGKARIAAAHHFSDTSGATRSPDAFDPYGDAGSATAEESPAAGDSGAWDSGAGEESAPGKGSYGTEGGDGTAGSYGGDETWGAPDTTTSEETDNPEAGHRPGGKSWGIDGSCPDGSDFSTSVTVERKPGGGAQAGLGGGRDEVNTAAVAAGGALLSAAVGFGVHMLRRRRSAGS
ncbi:hypothetical protein N566_03870 [Streptomycetaceae bacterium MP113-05]|nr:hypothetical protein N566_03870 [Streptomycetaceae bacterium MP113-05]